MDSSVVLTQQDSLSSDIQTDAMPLVSVIIPVYKVEAYLRECVDSVLNQTYKNLEIILVDDGSPDGCPAICDELRHIDRRVAVVHKQNGGLYAARWSGIGTCHGKYIAFVDSDDWVEPDFIQKLYECASESDADIASCDLFLDSQKFSAPRAEKPGITAKEATHRLLGGFLSGYTCLKLVRADVFKTGTYIDVGRLSMWEDVVLSVELYHNAKNIAYTPIPLYHYRYNPNSLCHSYSEKTVSDLVRAVQFVEQFLTQEGVSGEYGTSLMMLKARAKCTVLAQSTRTIRKKYLHVFSEADRFIFKAQTIPIYNKILAKLFLLHLTPLAFALQCLLSVARTMRAKIKN